MKIINQLCDYGRSTNVSKLFPEMYAPETMYETMFTLAPDKNETFAFCKLFNKRIDCNEIFFTTLSDSGYCYSFNTLRIDEYLTDEWVS